MTRADERRFSREPGLRTRPLPELGCLLVFTPARPRLRWLNASAWLLLELCEDASEEEIAAEYATAWQPADARAGLREELRAGLEELVRGGIVRVRSAASPTSDPPPTNQRGDRQ